MTTSVPRKVMLTTDLTPAGDRAFDRAVELAQEWDAELIVLHVVESSAARPWDMDRRIRNAETELDRLVRSAKYARKIGRHTVIGDPAERTLAHARDIGCDFLITGPAHGKIVGEKLLGSTAARIVRRATVPVLAVRRRPEGAISQPRRGGRFLGFFASRHPQRPDAVSVGTPDRAPRLPCRAELERS